jgi:hypothetical protein
MAARRVSSITASAQDGEGCGVAVSVGAVRHRDHGRDRENDFSEKP